MATKTARHELTNFLSTKLSADDLMAFNKMLHDRPDLSTWLDVPEHRRGAILEADGQAAARHGRNAGGPSR